MHNENDMLDQRKRRSARRKNHSVSGTAVSRPRAAASRTPIGRPDAGRDRPAPVRMAVWRAADGTRLRLTHVTAQSVDFENLTTGGNGVMARAWLEKHYTAES